ncbi:Ribonuclease H-like protein, partial [Metarhizium majus ARSEF 297]
MPRRTNPPSAASKEKEPVRKYNLRSAKTTVSPPTTASKGTSSRDNPSGLSAEPEEFHSPAEAAAPRSAAERASLRRVHTILQQQIAATPTPGTWPGPSDHSSDSSEPPSPSPAPAPRTEAMADSTRHITPSGAPLRQPTEFSLLTEEAARPTRPTKPSSLRGSPRWRVEPYTRSQYVRDAALIRLAKSEIDSGQHTLLQAIITDDIVRIARLVGHAMTTKERRITDAVVLRQLIEEGSGILDSAPDMAKVITRLENGPSSDFDEEEIPAAQITRRPEQGHQPPERRPHDFPPPRRSEEHADRRPSWDSPQFGLNPTPRLAPMMDAHHQQAPRQDTRVDRRPARTFKAELLAYDSKVTPISAYLSQLDWLAGSHGTQAVLENIVPGLLSAPASDGCQWFNSLNPALKARLAHDFDLWKRELSQRFRKNRGAIIMQADALKHSFSTEDTLPLQSYIDQKVALYMEAGGLDEDLIARRVVLGVDSSLAKLVDVSQEHLTLSEVKAQLSTRQWAALQDWTVTQKEVRDLQKSFQDLKETQSRMFSGRRRDDDRRGSGREAYGGRDRSSQDRSNREQGFQSRNPRVDTDYRGANSNYSTPFRYAPRQDRNEPTRGDRDVRRRDPQRTDKYEDQHDKGQKGNQRQTITIQPDQYRKIFGKEGPPQPVRAFISFADGEYQLSPDEEELPDMDVRDSGDESGSLTSEDPPKDFGDPSSGLNISNPLSSPIPDYARSPITYAFTIGNIESSIHSYSQLHGVAFTPSGRPYKAIFDTAAPIILASRRFLSEYYPKTPLSNITPFPIGGIGKQTVCATQTAELSLSFRTLEGKGLTYSILAYVVDNLSCEILLGLPFLRECQLHIRWGQKTDNDYLISADNESIPVSSAGRDRPGARPFHSVKIRAASSVVVPGGHGFNMEVKMGRDVPVRPDGYVLTPMVYSDHSGHGHASAPHAIITGQEHRLQVSNLGDAPVKIRKGQIIGTISPARITSRQQVFMARSPSTCIPLADLLGEDCPEEEPPDPRRDDGYPFNIPVLDPGVDFTAADISDSWGQEYEEQIRSVLLKHRNLFRPGLGQFNDGIHMPVPLHPDADLSNLNQRPYAASRRDREAMDDILNPLKEAGVVEDVPLGEPCPVASPAFVVWRDGKPRVVIDMRRVNTKLVTDAYPLPRQDDILSSLQGSTVFSALDLTKGFFQQPIAESDRWKTSFVTPHRGHERLTVSTMGLATSPAFFQHRMEYLFRQYLWKFVLIYIDDIIIFSRTIEEHVKHLDLALAILNRSGCTLSLRKCHFAQPGLQALGHYVSRLGLSTTEEKTAAILALAMPTNLKELEHGLGLMGYYRQFIDHYSAIVEPLQQIKAMGFRKAPPKNPQRDSYAAKASLPLRDTPDEEKQKALWKRATEAWTDLKSKLAGATKLAHPDFTKPFELHVDGSKQFGFGAALHQLQADGKLRPILFLSKALTSAERNYGSTELETAALVWALQKLEHYLDHSVVKAITDHTAIRDTFQSIGSSKPKGKYRLTNWRLYLEKWRDKIQIVYREGRKHLNADALSRMPRMSDKDTKDTLNVLIAMTRRQKKQQTQAPALQDDDDTNKDESQFSSEFEGRLVTAIQSDPTFKRMYQKLQGQDGASVLAFSIHPRSRVLFYHDGDRNRICLPASMTEEVFKMVHDDRAHPGSAKSFAFLSSLVFFHNMRRQLHDYIVKCPECQKSKPRRQQPFGSMQPVKTPQIPLHTICLDFVTGLPEDDGYDAILAITDKFSKVVRCIPGNLKWSAEDWANAYVRTVYPDWGMPHLFIHDVDSKLVSQLWQSMCKVANVKTNTSAPHHQQANGQSERTIQTLIHSLRTIIGGRLNTAFWLSSLPHVVFCMNSSLHSTTRFSPFELLYGRQPRHFLNPAASESSGQNLNKYGETQKQRYQEAWDATQLSIAKMKLYYDTKHTPPPGTGSQ